MTGRAQGRGDMARFARLEVSSVWWKWEEESASTGEQGDQRVRRQPRQPCGGVQLAAPAIGKRADEQWT